MSRLRLLAGFAAASALAAAMLPGFAAAEVPSAQVPDDLKSVIQEHVESKGHDYAGLCRDVNEGSPAPFTYCAFVLSIEHEIAEVTYGPVLSDEVTFVSFELKNGEWVLRTDDEPANQPTQPTSPVSPTPKPPATGSGIDTSEDDDGLLLAALAALGAVSILGLGASALAVRK